MSTSTNAYLWLGLAGEQGDRDDFDTAKLHELLGEDAELIIKDGEWTDFIDGELSHFDCELVRHQSYSAPVYGIALKSSSYHARRGEANEVVCRPATKRQIEKLRAAAAAVGWIGGESIAWHLASFWGV